MKFLNPAGLWLLLGVPILIAIYLIRSRHEDRNVSSTYIWKLSRRFMKKRLPFQRIRKILLFVLQLVLIVAAAFLAARPAMVNGKACDYIAIVDASASMQQETKKGVTRFEKAISEVSELCGETVKGHKLSVILATEKASYLIQNGTDANEIRLALGNAVCGFGTCDTDSALSLAQTLCEQSQNPKVIFYTDETYETTKNIEVKDMSREEWNVSITSLSSATRLLDTDFSGTLTSFGKDANLTVGLRVDGKLLDARSVECADGEETSVSFTVSEMTHFDTAELFVDVEDALKEDNSFFHCRKNGREYNILLISNSPLYLRSALLSFDNCKVEVAKAYNPEEHEGKDLYIFDGITPEAYPEDGSVLLFGTENLPDTLVVGETSGEEAALLTVNRKVAGGFFEEIRFQDTMVKKFAPISGKAPWQFLLTCDNASVLATRKMAGGLRFTVVSFDLHDTNLPMQSDFLLFMKDLVEYSVPDLIHETEFVVGEEVEIAVLPAAKRLYLKKPDGNVEELSMLGETISLKPDTVGVYTVVMEGEEGGVYADFFMHLPEDEFEEKDTGVLELVYSYRVTEEEPKEAISEVWFWLSLAMLVILLVEWGWYYREQY